MKVFLMKKNHRRGLLTIAGNSRAISIEGNPHGRYFISRYDAGRLRRAGTSGTSISLTVQIYKLEQWRLEQEPERFLHLVEVEVKDA
jgi:superfamily II DNA/RNA helicase